MISFDNFVDLRKSTMRIATGFGLRVGVVGWTPEKWMVNFLVIEAI